MWTFARPSGIAGGSTKHLPPSKGGVSPPGFKQGTGGSSLPALKRPVIWQAGGTAEVSWNLVANQ